MRKRLVLSGPIGFTPGESKFAAALAIMVLAGMVFILYDRLNRPAPIVEYRSSTIPGIQSGNAGFQPGKAADSARSTDKAAVSWVGDRLDINAADYADLLQLPGIGPVLAGRIIEYRDRHGFFLAVDSLICVSGIGPKKLAQLRPLLVIR